MQLLLVRLASAAAIALVYMLFDVFNHRNVPSAFAYGSLAYGLALTLLYLNAGTILTSLGIAAVVLGVGYAAYRIGQVGAADVIEIAALSMILPVQVLPRLLPFTGQLGLPFIAGVLINTGIFAMVMVPLYYIPIAMKRLRRPLASYVGGRNAAMAAVMLLAYASFILFAEFTVGISAAGIIVLALMAVSSASVMLLAVPITLSMVRYVTPREMDEGDIVAVNLLDAGRLRRLKGSVDGFDRLLNRRALESLRKGRPKEKLPVYKDAMPLALPIFAAVIAAMLAGNILLLVI